MWDVNANRNNKPGARAIKGDTMNETQATTMIDADNDYDKQAEDFLTRNGLEFRANMANVQKCPPWSRDDATGAGRGGCSKCGTIHGVKFTVTLRRTATGKRLSFAFWGSFNDGNKPQRAYSVLACISGDIFCPNTFDKFVSEYGYDDDSIKAWRAFKRCSAFGKRLREFFTDEEQTELADIR